MFKVWEKVGETSTDEMRYRLQDGLMKERYFASLLGHIEQQVMPNGLNSPWQRLMAYTKNQGFANFNHIVNYNSS